jgi:single-stranded-DNA-specific exonuclease
MPLASLPSVALPVLRPRWASVEPPDTRSVDGLVRELSLPAAVCALLVQRGYADPAAARAFLKPSRDQIHAPETLAGMGVAVERLSAAVRTREPVLVHGDYDVDGVAATAVLVRALRMMGGRAAAFVPHRLHDGYDLGRAGIAAAGAIGARLIVTVDCGVVAHGAIREARSLGIDVIVTDHHSPQAALPEAIAVVNPKRADCPYPGKGLAGAGVAFKLAVALAHELAFPEERLASLLDLVAVATIADLVPLTDENRALVRWGLAVLSRTPNVGLRALLRSSGLADRPEIGAGQVGFILAPRLNAAGRLGDAMRGVRLLLTEDPSEAERIAAELEGENRRRRELDESTLADALRRLEREYDPERDRGVVLASPGWHPGVIGIVASRIVERIHRPCVLIATGADEAKGSARSIPGFHLYEAIAECSGHLIRFGGHRAAAGCSIHPSRIEDFREAFDAVARQRIPEDALSPTLRLDGRIRLPDANHDLFRYLRHFGPFGVGNPTPVFAAYGVRARGAPRVVGKNHLKLRVAAEGAELDAIGFGMAEWIGECRGSGDTLDIAFRLEENDWGVEGGRARLQARLVDLRRSG